MNPLDPGNKNIPATGPGRAGTTILCVDDEPNVLAALCLNLQRHYRVLTAGSGAEGLETLQREAPVAVILSDMRMPQMDGATFLNRARELAPDAIRMLLTGESDMRAAAAAVNNAQVFRFLIKPCPPAQLLAEIGTAVSQYRLVAIGRMLMEQTPHADDPAFDSRRALTALLERARRIFNLPWAALGLHDGMAWPPREVIACGIDPQIFLAAPIDQSALPASLLAGDPVVRIVAGGVSGLPPAHPQATQLLGAPIEAGGVVHGWYYLAGNASARIFSSDDERVAAMLGTGMAAICSSEKRRQLAETRSAALALQLDRIELLSLYDPVTRLANRSQFLGRLRETMTQAQAQRRQFAVVGLDIERFRSANAISGADAATGDAALKAFAARLQEIVGADGLAGRTGDEHFVIVIAEVSDTGEGQTLLQETLLARLSAPMKVGGRELRIDLRLGMAVSPEQGGDAENLLHKVEIAMIKARRDNQRRVVYTEQIESAIVTRASMEERLRVALARSQFRLYYQPSVELASGSICGAEALLRWDSPELGLVPPLQFIGLLEETGLILDVGRWALGQALADRAAWQAQGLTAPTVAVNVSQLQLQQPGFVDTLRELLSQATIKPHGLALEITESMLMSDVEESIGKLGAVRDMGVPIAIDDFGTGYSSLAYLARLPVSAIKIDRSFVVRMIHSASTRSIVASIISLARSLGLRVVAEGVESAEQLKLLRNLRCDEFQGFVFSEALPAREFAALLAAHGSPVGAPKNLEAAGSALRGPLQQASTLTAQIPR